MIFLHSRIVEHLLTNNANASKRDKKGFTAIHYASVKGNKLSIEMVSFLLYALYFVNTFTPSILV